MTEERVRGAGGTPGGVGMFFVGVIVAGVGAYLLLNQVEVVTSGWHFWGFNAFGLSMVPMLVGIGILFYNGKSVTGWILLALGAAIILAGILVNMDIYFRPTSLYNTLFMLALLAAGLGLISRSLK